MSKRGAIRLTKAAVESLQSESSAYFVSVVNAKGQAIQGLNVRVLTSGKRVFVHRYRFDGVQKTFTLGRWPAMTCDAAEKASMAAQVQVNSGRDPGNVKSEAKKAAAAARQAAFTVANLATRYIEEHIPDNKPSWQKEATRLIQKHIVPNLGDIPLKAVGSADVSALLHKIRKVTPTQANRVRAVLQTMFGRAEEWELRPLGSNPVRVVKQRAPEKKRERRLSDVELKALGIELRKTKESCYILAAVRLALLGGMRKGEIQALRWEWVDLDAEEIHLPAFESVGNAWTHKTARKTGEARVVYLCSALQEVLKALPKTQGCPYVVPGLPKKNKEGKIIQWRPFIGLQGPWERIRVASGLAIEGKPSDEDPTWHDLRRTFSSIGTDLGLKGFMGELLGHAEQTVTDIYTRSAEERLREATEAIGTRINGILSGAVDPEKEAEDRRKGKAAKLQVNEAVVCGSMVP